MLPRHAEGKVKNPFSSAEKPSAVLRGQEQLGKAGEPIAEAGRRKARELQKEGGVDLRKLSGELGKLCSWQRMWSWEEGGARGICLFLAGCLEEGVPPASQAAGTEKGLQEVTGFSLGHIYLGGACGSPRSRCYLMLPGTSLPVPFSPGPLVPHSRDTIS